MAFIRDYSDGRLFPHKGKRPIPAHLLPDAIPEREKTVKPSVLVRRGGSIRAIILDDGEVMDISNCRLQAI